MSRVARKVGLILMTSFFVALVTGLSLYLHLLNHEHPEDHDAAHCPICQRLLIKPGKFITEPESHLPDFNRLEGQIAFYTQSYTQTFHFDSFRPRPPPQLPLS
ncbi:MAG: hypothetical protein JXM79_09820 [Sedimentisphaerales bacterium]|nr:hypothetical protein [Sedimentisphaerales bacterium]